MRDVRNLGVLGLITPGLMAVLPIDSRTQVLLYDQAVYTPTYSVGGCIDVIERSDISCLNALQLHASEENVYFADLNSDGYVRELIAAHAPTLRSQSGGFEIHSDGELLIRGVPNTGEVMHTFEPQLPMTLELSVLRTLPLQGDVNPIQPRNTTIAREVEEALRLPGDLAPLSVAELARWMESQIQIS